MNKKTFYALFIGFCALACKSPGEAKMTAYYIPFSVETYIPVTVEDIEEKAHFVFLIEGDYLKKINELLTKKSEGTFDGQKVRMKLKSKNGDLFVDANGGVVGPDHREFKISALELENLITPLLQGKKSRF
jgi:hypothetical protein